MKTNTLSQLGRFGLIAFCATSMMYGAEPTGDKPAADKQTEARTALAKQVSEASNFYTTLQSKAETAIPDWVVSQARGVLIFTRWSGAVGVGGTGGTGIGMKKSATGAFSAPAFYTLGGASVGAQVGVSKTQTIAFLMSDKAMQTLTDNKFVWSGNVRAVGGSHSASSSTVDNRVDVIVYQQSSGFDVGAVVAVTEVSIDNTGNHVFYGDNTIAPAEILSGKVKTPLEAVSLVTALTKQSSGNAPQPAKTVEAAGTAPKGAGATSTSFNAIAAAN